MAKFVVAASLIALCCINCSTEKLDSENEVLDKLDRTAESFVKAEVAEQGYPSTNTTSDRLELLEVLLNLLSEDVYDVRVYQEVMRLDLLARLEAIDEKLEDHIPSGQMEYIMATYLKDFRPFRNETNVPKVHRDCQAALRNGWTQSGLFMISPDGGTPMEVFCDQKSSGGGWTVIQNRQDGRVDFHRSWRDYKDGFGELLGDFWLGNEKIHQLTKSVNQQLMVQLLHLGHGFSYVKYTFFRIGDEQDKYQLEVRNYTGINSPGDSLMYHNKQYFSTPDVDNDVDCNHCAATYGAGWWFKNCSMANLNGVYGSTSEKGITWSSWMGSTTSLTGVKMMVRPAEEDVEEPKTTPAITTTSAIETTALPAGKNCQEVYANGGTTSGVYTIYPAGGAEGVQVYCEQDLEDGGWTVFQSRKDGSVNFTQGWAAYKGGFGSASTNHWLGNDNLHLLTANKDTKLLIELQNNGLKAYAHYNEFWVADLNNKFRLHARVFSNGLNNPGDSLAGQHDGMKFSSPDQDNDEWPGHCAATNSAGWWYKACSYCDLNRAYGDEMFHWYTWSGHGSHLDTSRMMLKRK